MSRGPSDTDYQDLVERAPLGIYRTSPDGRLLYGNEAFCSIIGYAPEELPGMDVARDLYVDPEERALVLEQIREMHWWDGLEVRVRRKDGRIVHTMVAARPIFGADGRVEFYEGIMQDITVRKHLESQLGRMRHLESVERLAGNMAHELNNLLTVISTNLEFAVQELPPDAESIRRDLDDARDATRRATELVRKVRHFGAQEALQPRVLDLTEMAAREARRTVGETEGVELVLNLASEPCWVNADPDALVEVLRSVLENAVDAMPDGGTLEVTSEVVPHSPTGAAGQPHVRLHVRDTGLGMTAQVCERIFEPFFSTKEGRLRTGGTGLGMALVHGLMRQHSGTVDVESTPGGGTVVTLSLPYQAPPGT